MKMGAGSDVSAVRRLPALGGAVSVFSGFLLHLSLGGLYSFGNLTTYLTSYLRVRRGLDVGYGQTQWVSTAIGLGEGPALFLGSACYRRFGPRVTILLGAILTSGATAVTFLTVDTSLAWVVITYGLMNGFGVGFAYSAPLLAGYNWFPQHRGLVSGIVVGGYGLGGIIFTNVQTAFVNPEDVSTDDDGFFHDDELLDRVPWLFLLQAGIALALQTAGFLGVHDPPPTKNSEGPNAAINHASFDQGKEASSMHEEAAGGGESEDGPPIAMNGSVSSDATVPNSQDQSVEDWKQSLRTIRALQFTVALCMNSFAVAGLNPIWKAFGQTFISDDHFFELVGSGASAFNFLGRIAWGILCDVTGYKSTMVLLTGLFCAFLFTLPATSWGGQAMYLLWIWGIYFSFSGTFSVLVTGVAVTFGTKNAGQIYGAMFMLMSLLSPLATLCSEQLLDHFGYEVTFLGIAVFTAVSLVSTLTFKPGKQEASM